MSVAPAEMDLNEIKENACAINFTERKEYIMSFPSKTKLVNIHDTTLTRRDLECLLEDEIWVESEVINAYIYCLRVQDKFCTAGARVFLETTYDSGILKRDGEIPISLESHHHIVEKVLKYLQHDMVRLIFLPMVLSFVINLFT
nr:uncharacterized protein LOC120964577 [Aegilops tauschii subsp. strangulata]